LRRRALVDGCSARRLVATALLATALAVLIALEYLGLLSGVDSMVFQAVARPGLVAAELVSATAGIPVFAVYAAALLAYDVARRGRVSLGTVSLGVSLVIAMVLVAVLKASLQVPRPGEQPLHRPLLEALMAADYYAFPSGHTARAVVAAYYLSRGRRGPVRVALWAWALAVAASRVLLGAHWVSDVAASVVLGLLVALVVECTAPVWLRVYNATLGRIEVLRPAPA